MRGGKTDGCLTRLSRKTNTGRYEFTYIGNGTQENRSYYKRLIGNLQKE